jgi:predicted GNAT family acetyltransferase
MVDYGDSKDVDLFQLAKLLTAADGVGFSGDVSRLAELVRGSTRVAWATDNGHLVAFASALSDGAHFGFVTYLVVRADRRGQGLEAALVERLVAGQSGVTFLMSAPPSAASLCEALGFTATDSLCFARKA